MDFKEIKLSDEFIKYELNHFGAIPFHAAVHHLKGVDKGDPHDHPFDFESIILQGSYIERVYTNDINDGWSFKDWLRRAGERHLVKAECIHQIIKLPQTECWTIILPSPAFRKSHFWQFREDGAYSRAWDEKLWKRNYD